MESFILQKLSKFSLKTFCVQSEVVCLVSRSKTPLHLLPPTNQLAHNLNSLANRENAHLYIANKTILGWYIGLHILQEGGSRVSVL